MKRWILGCLVGILLLVNIWYLSGPALDPMDFAGKWYYSADSTPYLFHNGIIICEKYHISMDENEIFSGTYSFAKDKILLFLIDENGVGEIQELELVTSPKGDMLVASDGAVFYREKAA